MRGGEMASPYFHYHDSFGRFLESRVRLSCLKRVPKAPQSTMSHADLLFNHYRCTSPPSINSAGRARRHSNSYKLSKQQLPPATTATALTRPSVSRREAATLLTSLRLRRGTFCNSKYLHKR
ncbi:hypothetical protein Peur_060908 [Populus x canadensis]